jgi:hypothetical protein
MTPDVAMAARPRIAPRHKLALDERHNAFELDCVTFWKLHCSIVYYISAIHTSPCFTPAYYYTLPCINFLYTAYPFYYGSCIR